MQQRISSMTIKRSLQRRTFSSVSKTSLLATSLFGINSHLLFNWEIQSLIYTCRIRELTASKVGVLLKISGHVVRTHPVHPELVRGVFTCLDCNTVISGVEQQFKYTQVSDGMLFAKRLGIKILP